VYSEEIFCTVICHHLNGRVILFLKWEVPQRDLPYPEQVLPFSADFGHRKKKNFSAAPFHSVTPQRQCQKMNGITGIEPVIKYCLAWALLPVMPSSPPGITLRNYLAKLSCALPWHIKLQ
jgi:hypothetical protein